MKKKNNNRFILMELKEKMEEYLLQKMLIKSSVLSRKMLWKTAIIIVNQKKMVKASNLIKNQ